MKIRFAICCLIGSCLHAAAQPHMPPPADTSWVKQKWLDTPYSSDSPAQKLDIYVPNDGPGPFPVILSIHGGGFAFGDKHGGDLAQALHGVRRGYAVVSINYRLSGEAAFPACLDDARAALAFVRAHAADYRIDPKRVAVWGSSAGGNLAALLGTIGSGESAVQAVVDLFGPVNFLSMDAQFKASGIAGQEHDSADSFESRLLRAPIQSVPDLAARASPESYISADDPPFFIQHGSADKNIPAQQSRDFAEKLSAAIGKEKVVLEILDGAGHGGPAFDTPANLNKIFAFLDRWLKPGWPAP